MSRLIRVVAPALLLACLGAPALAQEEAPLSPDAGGGSKGSPVVGYVVAAFLIGGGMFILCKSARR